MATEKLNTLELRLIDPQVAKEEWYSDYQDFNDMLAGIYIDGVDIFDVFKVIELPYYKFKNHTDTYYGYGHLEAYFFYDLLNEALIEGSFSNKYGVYAGCCPDCGEPGCWSVIFYVQENDKYVRWYGFEHENRKEWKYDLEYIFDKVAYYKELEKLKKLKGGR